MKFLRNKWSLGIIVLLFGLYHIACTPEKNDTPQLASIDNQLIIDINEFTYTIANEHDQFMSFIGVRALAMVHLAIHDILNVAEPKYESYFLEDQSKQGNLIAASIKACEHILTTVYPQRADTIQRHCTKWLDTLADTSEKNKGIAFGIKVAKELIRLRAKDGHEKNGTYTPMTKAGDYQYTPGFDWVWKPDFSVAKPFALDSLTQFRVPTPPSLKSKEYAQAFNEVKAFGVRNSEVRTEDQTHFAHWWAEFGEHAWNRVGRITAKSQKLPFIETNRMFALINMSLYDLYLASFESKYFYDFWRPITAILNADKDGNPSTEVDPDWVPEMITPPWPDYPSTHAAVGACGAYLIAHVYDTMGVAFQMESVTALPKAKERRYTNLETAIQDCADSRIMNGFHFRFATETGIQQGQEIANFISTHFLQKKK